MALSGCPSSAAEEPINDNSSQNRRTSQTPEPDSTVGKSRPKKDVLQQQQKLNNPKAKARKEEERKKAPPCNVVVMGESMSLVIGAMGEHEGHDYGQGSSNRVNQMRRSMRVSDTVRELMSLPTHPEIQNWYPPRKWTVFEPSPPTSEDEEDAAEEAVKAVGGRRKKQKQQEKAAREKKERHSETTVGSNDSQEQDAAARKLAKKKAKYYVDPDLDAEDRLRCKVLHDQLCGSQEVKVMPLRIREERLWKIEPRPSEEKEAEGGIASDLTDPESKQRLQESSIPSLEAGSNDLGKSSVEDQEGEQEREEIPEAIEGGPKARGESMTGEGEEEEEEENGEEKAGGDGDEQSEGGVQRARSGNVGKTEESREAILADEAEMEGEGAQDEDVEEEEA